MKNKSLFQASLFIVFLLSFILIPAVTSSGDDLSKELQYYKGNYHQVKRVHFGPRNVDELKSGRYPKRISEKIFDFNKGDTQVYWVMVPLSGGNQYVGVNIRTLRGTESNYEFMQYHRPGGRGSSGETISTMPVLSNEGGKIDYLLLIKRKMGGGKIHGPSKSVETKVTFTYNYR